MAGLCNFNCIRRSVDGSNLFELGAHLKRRALDNSRDYGREPAIVLRGLPRDTANHGHIRQAPARGPVLIFAYTIAYLSCYYRLHANGFDWDKGNRSKCEKHGLSVSTIQSLFARSLAILPDAAHSQRERRFRAIGR